MITPQDALTAAIETAGSEKKLGHALGFSQHAIWHARTNNKISAVMARKLDEWSGGKFSRYELRPDVFGPTPNPESATA